MRGCRLGDLVGCSALKMFAALCKRRVWARRGSSYPYAMRKRNLKQKASAAWACGFSSDEPACASSRDGVSCGKGIGSFGSWYLIVSSYCFRIVGDYRDVNSAGPRGERLRRLSRIARRRSPVLCLQQLSA